VGPSTGGTTYQTEAFITGTVNGFGLGNCQAGWNTCAQTLAGGCCPTGFDCGTANCVAGSSIVGKQAPNGVGVSKDVEMVGWIFVLLGMFIGGTLFVL
jgi:hypothetical protein